MQELKEGTLIDGKYLIISRLGSGGMGSVYKAEQLAFKRYVALKILHSIESEDKDSERRFKQEAKILSELSSKYMPQFLDYGIWQEKIPYIAMELVESETLRQVLNREGRLSWRRALTIAELCSRGLADCHKMDMLHRDIKPENIFFDCSTSSLKLADFGLAKLISPKRQEELTATGLLIGSPQYMSPEQGRGLPLNAASDIYSLATVLYELICGKLPYEADNALGYIYLKNKEAPANIRTYLCSEEIPQGLEELLSDSLSIEASARPQDASKMQERLCEIMKTNSHLADYQIGLLSQPKPGQGKRNSAAKLLAALSLGAAVIALFCFALQSPKKSAGENGIRLGPVIGAISTGTKPDKEEKRIEALIETLSKRRAGSSRSIAKLYIQLSSLHRSKGNLDAVEKALRKALSSQSVVRDAPNADEAELKKILADCLSSKREYAEAVRLYIESANYYKSNERHKVAEIYLSLSNVLRESGQIEEAEEYMSKSLEITQSVYGKASPELAEALIMQGQLLRETENLMGSEKSLLEAQRILELAQLPESKLSIGDRFNPRLNPSGGFAYSKINPILFRCQEELFHLYASWNRPAKAEKHLQEAFSIFENASDGTDMAYISFLDQGCDFYRLQNQGNKARELCLKALKKLESLPQSKSAAACVPVLLKLSTICSDESKIDEAIKLAKQALDLSTRAGGQDSMQVADSLDRLSVLNSLSSNYDLSEKQREKAIGIREKKTGNKSLPLSLELVSLSDIYLQQGKYKEAKSAANRALLITTEILGANSPSSGLARSRLAAANKGLGNFNEARLNLEKNLAICRDPEKKIESYLYFQCLNELCTFYFEHPESSNPAIIDSLLSEMDKVFDKIPPSESRPASYTLCGLYTRAAKFAKAEQCLFKALKVQEETSGKNSAQESEILIVIADVKISQNIQLQEAEDLLSRALAIRKRLYGRASSEYLRVLQSLASLQQRKKDIKRFQSTLEEARQICLQQGAGAHNFLVHFDIQLAHFYRDKRRNEKKSEMLYKDALEIVDKNKQFESYRDQALAGLALLYEQESRFAEAEVNFRKLLDVRKKEALGADGLLDAFVHLSKVCLRQNKPVEARAALLSALKLAESEKGSNSSELIPLLELERESCLKQNLAREAEKLARRINSIKVGH